MATYTAEDLDTLFDTTQTAALAVESHVSASRLFDVTGLKKEEREKYEDLLCHAGDKYDSLTAAAVSKGKIETLTDEMAALVDAGIDVDNLIKEADGDTKSEKVLTAYLGVFNTVHESSATSLLGTLDVLAAEYADVVPTRASYTTVYGYLAAVCLAEAIEDAKEELDAIVPDDVVELEENDDDEADAESNPLHGIDSTVILSGRRTRRQVVHSDMVEFDDTDDETDSGGDTEEDGDFDLTEELADAEEDYSDSDSDVEEAAEEEDEDDAASSGSSDPPGSKRRSV